MKRLQHHGHVNPAWRVCVCVCVCVYWSAVKVQEDKYYYESENVSHSVMSNSMRPHGP